MSCCKRPLHSAREAIRDKLSFLYITRWTSGYTDWKQFSIMRQCSQRSSLNTISPIRSAFFRHHHLICPLPPRQSTEHQPERPGRVSKDPELH